MHFSLLFLSLVACCLAVSKSDICSLAPIDTKIQSPNFDASVYIDPCGDNEHPSTWADCQGRVCMRFGATHYIESVGKTEDRFIVDKKEAKMYITGGDRCWSGTVMKDEQSTVLTFRCDKSLSKGQVKVIAGDDFPLEQCLPDEPTRWDFVYLLNEPWICKERGVFTTLLVLLVVSIGCYIGIGMTYKGVVMGMTGIELVPNIDFWRDFPSKFMSGVRSLVDKVRGRSGYSEL
ncbi:hypothetical protein GEMRC1_002118 [Eukaryota sp. GEM-RC1]